MLLAARTVRHHLRATRPLIPLSTGTNNAFPIWCEPTVAGVAAALVAGAVVAVGDVSLRAKLVHIEVRLAKRNGAGLVIINREATEFDGIADLVIRDDIGTVLAPLILH